MPVFVFIAIVLLVVFLCCCSRSFMQSRFNFFQFMKDQKQKEAAGRSAVSGKKIKLKVKKSSKDKEVTILHH